MRERLGSLTGLARLLLLVQGERAEYSETAMKQTYDMWADANEADRRIYGVPEGDYSVREVESAMDGRGPRGW